MTTLNSEHVLCRNCGQEREQTILLSTNAFGSPDLDLRPPGMQRSTIEVRLQCCPGCGHCTPDLSKGKSDSALVASPEYRGILDDERFPELAGRFLARALLVAGSDLGEAAHWRLCAAWARDDAEMNQGAMQCRHAAAALFEQQRPFGDGEGGLSQGAVFIDVLRRAGQFEQAAAECESLLTRQAAVDVLRQVLEF
jgi:hypothetical protein